MSELAERLGQRVVGSEDPQLCRGKRSWLRESLRGSRDWEMGPGGSAHLPGISQSCHNKKGGGRKGVG